jgi:hypothetical protein
MKTIFKKTIFILALWAYSLTAIAQPIAEEVFGQNAWYTVYTDDGQLIHVDDHFTNNLEKVKASGSKVIRIGGAAANIFGNTPGNTGFPITDKEILFLVKKIRAAGMDVIIQAPYPNEGNDNSQLAKWANDAKALVNYINVQEVNNIPGGKVTKWAIGNEPDKHERIEDGLTFKVGYNYHATDLDAPEKIAKYIKQFAIKMRESDPEIKILGPSLSSYLHHFYFGGSYGSFNFTNKGLLENNGPNEFSGLIGTADVFGNATITSVRNKPYIDYISLNFYTPSNSITDIIEEVHLTSDNWKFRKGLQNINAAAISSAMVTKRTSAYPLKITVSEANTEHITSGSFNPSTFIAGQWWADFASICLEQQVEMINYWSTAENSFGFMNGAQNGTERSSYYHFQWLSENFKGTFLPNLMPSNYAITLKKVFGYKNTDLNEVGVIIMNQENVSRSL